MTRAFPELSMAYLTCQTLTPPDAVGMAAELGYDAVGIRILPSAPGGDYARMIGDRQLLAETRNRIADTGVSVFDVEIARLAADFTVDAFRPFLDVCGELGARAVLVAGDDPDEARLTASFAAFCEAAKDYGITGNLEFMPWTNVRNAKAAMRIVENAGSDNGRILIDALHAARSDTSLADLAAIPESRLCYAQICDAPAEIPTTDEGLIHTARCARLLPGDGGIDLVSMFSRIPYDLPDSIEIPKDEGVARLGAREWARQALERSKAVLAERAALTRDRLAG